MKIKEVNSLYKETKERRNTDEGGKEVAIRVKEKANGEGKKGETSEDKGK